MQLSGDQGATVGQPAKLLFFICDPKTSKPVTDVVLKANATQLENNWVAFAYQGTPDNNGKLAWQQEFFDGAPHSVVVEIAPMSVRLILLTYFTVRINRVLHMVKIASLARAATQHL